MRLLIVEDESKTAALLSESLMKAGFEVAYAGDGQSGLKQALNGSFDVLVCDIMLPHLDGLSFVRELRRQGRATPVIMLSARGEVEQRVEGLDAGADDYLPKPFATSELLARVRSLLRRNSLKKPVLLSAGDLNFDPVTRETRRAGRRVELSSREALLLECLLKAEGAVVSRRDIISAVWEYDFDPGTNLVGVYVRRLRDKIDRDFTPHLIQTVRGLGYALRETP
ncbi:MAG: response regulator transcription factor [Verrucomicrobiaceae bacterium]|nr:response regulator transcription factor [Verrucomicrobiaceae bacterium]